MSCCHFYAPAEGGDTAFAVDMARIVFGAGCLAEAGQHARAQGMTRVALLTDPGLIRTPHPEKVAASLRAAGVDVTIFAECLVEPTAKSFQQAAEFARQGRFDGYVSVGGGSVIDTAKAANLYASYPAEFDTYVNAPVGAGRAVPGALAPHIACPTTCGTGSECTGIAIFDDTERQIKTGIASPRLRPSLALIDPETIATLPRMVVACSAFDVLSHALESYTARPYTRRPVMGDPSVRPMSQGANPWSDLGCREALRLLGRHLESAVCEGCANSRQQLMWASTLAGIAFGNAGCHVPHGMSYAVAGLIKETGYQAPDYPTHKPLCPHGMSVIVNTPAVFRFTADASPERHLEAARLLGATADATPAEAGEVLAQRLIGLMKVTGIPMGLGAIGYTLGHAGRLADGTMPQQRLLQNAPKPIDRGILEGLFRGAMHYG